MFWLFLIPTRFKGVIWFFCCASSYAHTARRIIAWPFIFTSEGFAHCMNWKNVKSARSLLFWALIFTDNSTVFNQSSFELLSFADIRTKRFVTAFSDPCSALRWPPHKTSWEPVPGCIKCPSWRVFQVQKRIHLWPSLTSQKPISLHL